MNLTDLITSGRINRPQRGIIYGVEGVGKTKLATELPKPIIVDTESGSHQFCCHRIIVGNDQQLDVALHVLLTEPNDYLTVVIDSLDWSEKYLLGKICREKKVEGISDFPHGHGYTLLREAFDKFLFQLDGFIRLGKHVVLIGHAQVKTVQLPGLNDPFDRFELKIERRNSETVTEWADFQLFLSWDIRTAKTKDGIVRAVGGRDRLIYPMHTAAYDAKNRLGLTEPLKCEYGTIASLFGDILTPADEPSRDTVTPPHTSTTIPVVPDPDTAATEPFLSDTEIRVVQTIMESLPQDKLLKFLRDKKKIGPADDQTALGPTYLRKILANPAGFRDTITAYNSVSWLNSSV